MKIVTTTSVFPYDYPIEKATERLANIGFKNLDIALDYCARNISCGYMSENWREWAKNLRALADSLGVSFTHAHANGDASTRDESMMRAYEVCKILGVKYIVVHSVYKKSEGVWYTDDAEFIEVNKKALKPLLELAEKNGIIILAENLLWGSTIHPNSISALVSAVNSNYFGWCYDTGHYNAHGVSFRRLVGNIVPLSLHIHDNNGNYRDEHLIPGDGNIDWKGFLDTLREIGYKGDLVLEAHHQSIDAPDEERDAILRELLSRAERMNEYIESL